MNSRRSARWLIRPSMISGAARPDQRREARPPVGDRVERDAPAEDRPDEQQAVGDPASLPGHPMCRRLRHQHDHEQVGERVGPRLALPDHAHHGEDRQEHDRPANEDLRDRRGGTEDLSPVQQHRIASVECIVNGPPG
jgi:hypothetical protein